MGALEPQEEVAESESGIDREGSSNVLTDIVEENKDQGYNEENNQVEEAPVLNVDKGVKEEVQIITSPPKVQAKCPTFEILSKLHLSRAPQS